VPASKLATSTSDWSARYSVSFTEPVLPRMVFAEGQLQLSHRYKHCAWSTTLITEIHGTSQRARSCLGA
jgi:hypothetical protein